MHGGLYVISSKIQAAYLNFFIRYILFESAATFPFKTYVPARIYKPFYWKMKKIGKKGLFIVRLIFRMSSNGYFSLRSQRKRLFFQVQTCFDWMAEYEILRGGNGETELLRQRKMQSNTVNSIIKTKV